MMTGKAFDYQNQVDDPGAAAVCLDFLFFFQAEDGIRDDLVTGVQTCALPISIPAGVFRAGRALSTGPLRLARYRGRRRPGGRPGDRELPDHPGQARRADAFLRPAAAFPRPPEALAGGAAQGKIAAMLRWIACAAALGSAAERIGRPTTM